MIKYNISFQNPHKHFIDFTLSTSTNGEELGFTNNFTLKKVDLDAFSTMICIAHRENTFDKNNLRKSLKDGEDSNFLAGEQRIKGDRGFFEASNLQKDNQFQEPEWKRVYDLLYDKNESLHPGEKDFFYTANSSSKLDKFASFVIDRLSK